MWEAVLNVGLYISFDNTYGRKGILEKPNEVNVTKVVIKNHKLLAELLTDVTVVVITIKNPRFNENASFGVLAYGWVQAGRGSLRIPLVHVVIF
jgi:hypothetical protein